MPLNIVLIKHRKAKMSGLKLFYTGWFGKKGNSSGNKELKIDGDCTITNYDTRTNNKPDAYVKVRTYNNSIFVEEGSKRDKTPNVADFSEKKAKVLEEVSKLDSNDNGLSKSDILRINQNNKVDYINKWGLKDLAVDHKNGVLTLKWGDNDILRIDFSMKTNSVEPEELNKSNNATPKVHVVQSGDTLSSIAEKYGIGLQRLKDANPDIENFDKLSLGQKINLQKVEDVSDTNNAQETESKSKTHSKPTKTTAQCYADLYNSIPKEYNKYISKVAKNAGVSEDLVRFIILSEGEAGTRKAKLESYKCSSGVWTIGFGHTNNCRKDDEIFGEGKKITLDEAFDILEKDIIEMKRLTKHYVTEERFNGLPESIQSLCIDYYFQVGNGKKFKGQNFCDNADGEIYGALAAGSLYRGGDLRRTANAFMLALKGLSDEDKKLAVKSLKNKGYYDKIIASLGGAEKIHFINFCDSIA